MTMISLSTVRRETLGFLMAGVPMALAVFLLAGFILGWQFAVMAAFAGCGLMAFIGVCLVSRDQLRVLRGFLDEAIYGLSDSAKAFAIILFTDIFVGYHSPEGWTVLLDGIAHHFGLPTQENFILLFIATFPLILATIFKYWIFRYLNRVSPSSVATLKGMNGGG